MTNTYQDNKLSIATSSAIDIKKNFQDAAADKYTQPIDHQNGFSQITVTQNTVGK